MGHNLDDSSLDMLERLLHDEIRPHSATLPSEPNVMRTKKQAHRKTQSVSYMNPTFTRPISHSRQSSLTRMDSPTSPASPTFLSPTHRVMGGHRKFHSVGLPTAIQPYYNGGFPSAPNSPQPYLNHSPMQSYSPAMNQVGGQRIISPVEYQFPNMHQKSSSGSKMVDEFLVMKLENQATESSAAMRRLHPLMRDNQFATLSPELYLDGPEALFQDNTFQSFSPITRQEENDSFHSGVTEDVYHFNDESGMAGEDEFLGKPLIAYCFR